MFYYIPGQFWEKSNKTKIDEGSGGSSATPLLEDANKVVSSRKETAGRKKVPEKKQPNHGQSLSTQSLLNEYAKTVVSVDKRKGKEKVGDHPPKDKGPKFVLYWPVFEKAKLSTSQKFMEYLTASVPPAEGSALAKQSMTNFSAIWAKKKCEVKLFPLHPLFFKVIELL